MKFKRMNDTEELKPCPFCGGEAELINTDIAGIQGVCNPITVSCKNCRCNTDWFNNKNKAVSAWNIRKQEDK